MSKLLSYDYEIIYKPGQEICAVDTLSRVAGKPILHVLFMSQTSLWDTIKSITSTDLYMKKIRKLAAEKLGKSYS